jgi:hypothetical protein
MSVIPTLLKAADELAEDVFEVEEADSSEC